MQARFPFRRKALALLAAMLALFSPSVASAQSLSQAGFEAYLQYVAAKARGEGVSEDTISRTLSGLTFNQRVVDLDRAQPGLQNVPRRWRPISPAISTARRSGTARPASPRLPPASRR